MCETELRETGKWGYLGISKLAGGHSEVGACGL